MFTPDFAYAYCNHNSSFTAKLSLNVGVNREVRDFSVTGIGSIQSCQSFVNFRKTIFVV